jgi:Na+/H+ antiporter NhaD/arsenite permease-like protein
VIGIFLVVYAGMIAGRLPGLGLDRTGIAVLGAIAVVILTGSSPDEMARAIDFSTLSLLFGLMVISAQFRLAGAYGRVARWIAQGNTSPSRLLLIVTATSGALSAVLANDIIVLAMAPVLIDITRDRRLNPMPFLIGLAAGANAGSAATLIGNPQNILIGQSLNMSFARYLFLDAFVPSVIAIGVTWLVIHRIYKGKFVLGVAEVDDTGQAETIQFDRFQAWKAVLAVLVVGVIFVGGWWQRDVVALTAAGFLLVSRRLTSKRFLVLVDWNLLTLFAALFVLNAAVADTGAFASSASTLGNGGIDLEHPAWLFAVSALLSNVVSNVPATMILLPFATHSTSGAVLALSSTLAGNLIIVGSIANIIMVEQAARRGITVTWRTHAAAGIPITLITLLIAGAWLLLRYS